MVYLCFARKFFRIYRRKAEKFPEKLYQRLSSMQKGLMKNITVSKRTWKLIRKIKDERDLASFSKAVDFLIDEHNSLQRENLYKNQETGYAEKTIKNPEEMIIIDEIERHIDRLVLSDYKKSEVSAKECVQSAYGLTCQCLHCHDFFDLDLSSRGQEELTCPHCGWYFGIYLIWDDQEEISEETGGVG